MLNSALLIVALATAVPGDASDWKDGTVGQLNRVLIATYRGRAEINEIRLPDVYSYRCIDPNGCDDLNAVPVNYD